VRLQNDSTTSVQEPMAGICESDDTFLGSIRRVISWPPKHIHAIT